MKKTHTFTILFFVLLAIFVIIFTQRQSNTMIDEDEYTVAEEDFLRDDLVTDIPESTLTQKEIDGLLLMREEEKLAFNVYTALYDTWGMRIFSNIAASEQTHTDSVKTLLDRYNLEDPMKLDAGAFSNPALEELYDQLIEQGMLSAEEALRVGATIEDLDIYDINRLLLDVQSEDIATVYANLIRGSKNHMRAFIRQLENMGQTYDAQYISHAELEAILLNE